MKILNDLPLNSLSVLPLQGTFSRVFVPESILELIELLTEFDQRKEKYCFWGNGTNILPINRIVKTPVILYRKSFFVINDEQIIASSNISGNFLGEKLFQRGFQNLIGVETIPGTIGAGIKNNATFKNFDYLRGLQALWIYCDGKTMWVPADEFQYNYRKTDIPGIILLAIYRPLQNDSMTEFLRRELFSDRQSQPKGASLGSTFKNPPHSASYRLINEVRSKLSDGDVTFSAKHANFLEFKKMTAPENVWNLIKETKKLIYAQYNIALELEIKLLT